MSPRADMWSYSVLCWPVGTHHNHRMNKSNETMWLWTQIKAPPGCLTPGSEDNEITDVWINMTEPDRQLSINQDWGMKSWIFFFGVCVWRRGSTRVSMHLIADFLCYFLNQPSAHLFLHRSSSKRGNWNWLWESLLKVTQAAVSVLAMLAAFLSHSQPSIRLSFSAI